MCSTTSWIQKIAKLAEQFQQLQILEELTGGRRSWLFRYTPYVRLFEERAPLLDKDTQIETTESDG